MEILDSDSSPGVSLECSNLFSASHKQFLKEKDIGSSKRLWPLDFGATGRPCSDGSSTGWLLSDMDDNSKSGPCGVVACARVSFYHSYLQNCPPFANPVTLVLSSLAINCFFIKLRVIIFALSHGGQFR